MRMVQAAGPDVLRLGRGRATRYAWRERWLNLDRAAFPVFRVMPDGAIESAGELFTLSARQSVWMPRGMVTGGLPMEIVDARPSGFLGRHFAAVHANLRLPLRVTDWSDHHILRAMAARGEDLPGHFVIGEESFTRWQQLDIAEVTTDDYASLADATSAGHPPGSSAGGERPKFCASVDGQHRLVKFAARGSGTDTAARRWCDLLVLEHLALETIAAHGIAAARTRVIESSSHVFMDSERFDRVGHRGRLGVISLAALHDDLVDTWAQAAVALARAGRISEADARHLRWLDAFGALIGNTDRHQHNVVFFTDDEGPRLAPAFDQVSMAYAPTADGQVINRPRVMPSPTVDTLDVWNDAMLAARSFWERAGSDARVSPDLRGVCTDNAERLRKPCTTPKSTLAVSVVTRYGDRLASKAIIIPRT